MALDPSLSLRVVPPKEYEQFADGLLEFLPHSYQIEAILRGHLKYGHFDIFGARLYAPADAVHRHHLAIISPAGSANDLFSFSIFWSEDHLSDDDVCKLMQSFPISSWAMPVMVREIPLHLQPKMDGILSRLSEGELHLFTPMPLQVLSMNFDGSLQEEELPDGYYFGTLDGSRAEEVLSRWIGSPSETLEGMSQFLDKLPSSAVFYNGKSNSNFNSEDEGNRQDKLVSYSVYKHGGDLGMTYTNEDHRRKGLAKATTLHLASKIHEDKLPVFVLVDCNHEVSIRMHLSMGFQFYTKVAIPFYFPKNVDWTNQSCAANFEILLPESVKKWKEIHSTK